MPDDIKPTNVQTPKVNMESDRARRINSLHTAVNKSVQTQNQKTMQVSTEVSALTKEQQKLMKQVEAENLKFTTDTASAYNGVIKNLGKTIQNLSVGVKNITTDTAKATAGAIGQYGKAIGEDININKRNTIAMSLAKATPLLGYFAAKAVETEAFQNMSSKIGEKISGFGKAAFDKIRGKKGEGEFNEDMIPKMQRGGLVKKKGIVEVHAAEIVTPVDKILNKIKHAKTEDNTYKLNVTLNTMTNTVGRMEHYIEDSEKQKQNIISTFIDELRHGEEREQNKPWEEKLLKTLDELKVGMLGTASRFEIAFRRTLLKHPTFRALMMLNDIMKKAIVSPFKVLFGLRGGFLSDVKNATRTSNIYQQQVNLLALIYTNGMKYLRDIAKFTQVTAESAVGGPVLGVKDKTYSLFSKIKGVMTLGRKKDKRTVFERFSDDLNLDKEALKEAGISSFKDLLSPLKILRNMGFTKENIQNKLPDKSKIKEIMSKKKSRDTNLLVKIRNILSNIKNIILGQGKEAKQEKKTKQKFMDRLKSWKDKVVNFKFREKLKDTKNKITETNLKEKLKEAKDKVSKSKFREKLSNAKKRLSDSKLGKKLKEVKDKAAETKMGKKLKAAKDKIASNKRVQATLDKIRKSGDKRAETLDKIKTKGGKLTSKLKDWFWALYGVMKTIFKPFLTPLKFIGERLRDFLHTMGLFMGKRVGKLGGWLKKGGESVATAYSKKGAKGVLGLGLRTGAKVAGRLAGAGAGLAIGGFMSAKDMMQAVVDPQGFAGDVFTRAFSAFLGGAGEAGKGGMTGLKHGMMKGGALGAGIGSILPGVGTLIGGAFGALAGGILGFIGGEKISKAIEFVKPGLIKIGKAIISIMTLPFRLIWKGIELLADSITNGAYSRMKATVKENVKKWGASVAKMLSGIPIIGQFFEQYSTYTPPTPKPPESEYAAKENLPYWQRMKLARERMEATKKKHYVHPYYKNRTGNDSAGANNQKLIEDAKNSIKGEQNLEVAQANVGIATLSKLDEIDKTLKKTAEENKATTMASSSYVSTSISNAVNNNRVNNSGGGGNPHFSNAQQRANAVASANIQ
jgi:uncharacterized protein with PIN domain